MEGKQKHYWLYALQLEQGKYYVGITAQKSPEIRIAQHSRGFMSAKWTRHYKPISTLEVRDLGWVTEAEAEGVEQDVTLQYMQEHGYQNVRGGRLNYEGEYIKVGNRLFTSINFEALQVICYLLATNVLLLLLLIYRTRQGQ